MADDHGAVGAGIVEQAGDVVAQRDDVVVLDRVGLRRPAVPALVGGKHAVAGLGQRRDLMAPRVRQFRKAVRQDHHGRAALARLDDSQPHSVRIN